MTRDEIILGALQLLGEKSAFDTTASLTGEEQALGASKLNAILSMMSSGSELWTKNVQTSIILSAGNAVYDLNSLLTSFAGEPEVWLYQSMLPVKTLAAAVAAGGTLTASTQYFYKVDAYDSSDNCLAISPEVSATTDASNRTINLSWTAVAGASTYRVFRSTRSQAQASYFSTVSTSLADAGAVVYVAGSPYDALRMKVSLLPQEVWDGSASTPYLGDPMFGTINADKVLTIRPAPLTDGIMLMRYRTSLLSTSSASSVPDLPIEWGLALQYGTALEMAPAYRTPLAEISFLQQKWEYLKRQLEADNVQDNRIEIGVDD